MLPPGLALVGSHHRPEQILESLPQALRVLTDPADCGPVTLALPQDVQTEAYDYPEAFFAPYCWRPRRPPPDPAQLADAAAALTGAKAPLIVAIPEGMFKENGLVIATFPEYVPGANRSVAPLAATLTAS